MNFLPSKLAAIPVVKLPAKGSRIVSPCRVLARIIRYRRRNGFCVGCLPQRFSHNPTEGNFQTSGICFPPFNWVIRLKLRKYLLWADFAAQIINSAEKLKRVPVNEGGGSSFYQVITLNTLHSKSVIQRTTEYIL